MQLLSLLQYSAHLTAIHVLLQVSTWYLGKIFS